MCNSLRKLTYTHHASPTSESSFSFLREPGHLFNLMSFSKHGRTCNACLTVQLTVQLTAHFVCSVLCFLVSAKIEYIIDMDVKVTDHSFVAPGDHASTPDSHSKPTATKNGMQSKVSQQCKILSKFFSVRSEQGVWSNLFYTCEV